MKIVILLPHHQTGALNDLKLIVITIIMIIIIL